MHRERRVKREKPTRCNWSDVHYQTFMSTFFGHHYAHHQENKSVYCRIWCSALVVMAVVVWSWDAICVHCKSYCQTVTFTVNTVRVPAPHNHSHHNHCRTPYAAVHTLVLLMMGIMMPETCWAKSLIINIRLVASCWFLSLHPTFMTHGHKSLKTVTISCPIRRSYTDLLVRTRASSKNGYTRTLCSWERAS